LDRIKHHRELRTDERERRALVSALVRSFNLPRPVPEIGEIVAVLARAGVFRLRAVLVGTVAYQSYSAMLGVRLPAAVLQTGDIDIAQFRNISVAVGDHTAPVLEILRQVDKSFRAVPNLADPRRVSSYIGRGGLRVDFLTPNQGPETERPQSLPALSTDAQPLRFLDYLIHEPQPAVLLHGAGIYVHVPAPERYAIHKLIISQRRPTGVAKRDKDIQQAEALIEVLVRDRQHELKAAWEEAYHRGPRWRELLADGFARIGPRNRDLALKMLGVKRAFLSALDLTFDNSPAHADVSRGIISFVGTALGEQVPCAISLEALADHFSKQKADQNRLMESFGKNRSTIEGMARAKYLSWPIEESELVLIRTKEVPRLLKASRSELTRQTNRARR
jgi:hypothetical protein